MDEENENLNSSLSRAEAEVISYFCDAVRVIGLPKSIGEIYGLLYITQEPLSLDDLVERLEISKGSASQGLKFLRNLNAIHREEVDRKAYYTPELQLKKLVAGFIKEEISPHLKSGQAKLRNIKSAMNKEEEKAAFYKKRYDKLERWTRQAKLVLPLIRQVLKS